MRINRLFHPQARTHEGALAYPHLTAEQKLRRSVSSCFLWEREFYEDGMEIGQRISGLVGTCDPSFVRALALESRTQHNLRHVPLLLLAALGWNRRVTADAVYDVIQRADEIAELVALYWKDGKKPLPAQMKKGLARAFAKFDAYQLAKYDRESTIRLRDVLFLVHAKPKDLEQAQIWRQLVDGTLPAPDTWEVSLSAGANKKATFERLLTEGRLGYLALLRNLRTMAGVGVDEALIRQAILARKGAGRVLPFRFVAAARAAPRFAFELEQALHAAIEDLTPLSGRTLVLVDVSWSMNCRLSAKSDLTRMDAAATLASILPGSVRVFSFSNQTVEVPQRRGLAGVAAVIDSQPRSGTLLGEAVIAMNAIPHDRLIVLTDEQSQSWVPAPVVSRAYMINVASYRNGVGYGPWVHIDGFSESVLRFIHEYEAASAVWH